MAAIGFYHLTRTTAEAALAPLLGRTLDGGARAIVRCPDPARVAALDAALWRLPEPSWLPHGSGSAEHPSWQPIWLTAGADNPNGATFLFLLDAGDWLDPGPFVRVFDLFDGNDAAGVAAARERWKRGKEGGHELTYWRQDEKGWTRAGRTA